jgi:hypothetical protein
VAIWEQYLSRPGVSRGIEREGYPRPDSLVAGEIWPDLTHSPPHARHGPHFPGTLSASISSTSGLSSISRRAGGRLLGRRVVEEGAQGGECGDADREEKWAVGV